MPLVLAITLTIGCLLSLCQTLRRHIWHKSAKAITALWQEKKGCWQLQDARQKIHTATLCTTQSLRTTQFVLLNFSTSSQRFKLPVIIWRDALDADSFRHLRKALLTDY